MPQIQAGERPGLRRKRVREESGIERKRKVRGNKNIRDEAMIRYRFTDSYV